MSITETSGEGQSFHEPAENSGIVIRCYTVVGVMKSYGQVEVSAKEFIVLERMHAEQFVTVQVISPTDHSGTVPISYDEVDKVIRAIDRLSVIDPKNSKYKMVEVEFALESGFKLIVFNNEKGRLNFTVSADGASVFFDDLARLTELKNLIEKAKATIDTNRRNSSAGQ